MAMTKKEKAAVEAMQAELKLLASFHRTTSVERDIPKPTGYNEMIKGWDYNAYSMRVYKACSSSSSHGEGWERTTSQGGFALYSSKMRALRALRHAVEKDCMTNLRKIDRWIEQEENECDHG